MIVRWVQLFLSCGLLLATGCGTLRPDGSEFLRARFVLESAARDGFAALATLPLSKVQIRLEGEAVLSEFDYHAIELAEVELGKCLVFTLKPTAARAFYQITVAKQGRRLVLLLNGEALGVRRLEAPIANGKIFVFLETGDERLEEIANQLRKTNFEIQKKLSK